MLRGPGGSSLFVKGVMKQSRDVGLDWPAATHICSFVNQILPLAAETPPTASQCIKSKHLPVATGPLPPFHAHILSLSCSAPATLASFPLALQQVKLILASEPLHWLFLLPHTLFLPLDFQMVPPHSSQFTCPLLLDKS